MGWWLGGKRVGWSMCGDGGEAFEEGGGGGVEELVRDAVDPAVADGAEVVPVALGDDAVEGDTVPCSAPGEEEDVRVGGGYGVGGGVGAGFAEEACHRRRRPVRLPSAGSG